jgi:hypothetical protein
MVLNKCAATEGIEIRMVAEIKAIRVWKLFWIVVRVAATESGIIYGPNFGRVRASHASWKSDLVLVART